MRFQLLGGPADHELRVPWPEDHALPPYCCSGDQEPFLHYARLGDLPIFVFMGECRDIDHEGSYPHSYFS